MTEISFARLYIISFIFAVTLNFARTSTLTLFIWHYLQRRQRKGSYIAIHHKPEHRRRFLYWCQWARNDKRVRNFRPDFNVTIEELAAGNYYPVTSRIVLKDEGTGVEFAVLNDRAQGGTSLRSGEVELMVCRIRSKYTKI